MMDPSSHDLQHQQAELLLGSSPLAAAAPHFHFPGSNHEWNQTLMLSGGANIIQDINGVVSTSRDFRLSHETPLSAPLSTPKVHDLGFHWGANNLNAESYMSQSPLSQIKEELSDSSTIEDYHLPSTNCIKPQPQGFHELHEKLLMRSFSSGCQINGLQTPASGDLLFDNPSLTGFGEAAMRGRGNFSMVLPSTHVSSSIPQPLPFSSSLGMDLHALDLLTSVRFGRPLPQPSINSIPFLKESMPYGLGILQELSQGQENGHLKIPSLIINGVSEEKRCNSLLEHKACQAAPKKPRLESRPSFSPFKVRKEKLGDRIAALQQLVAPFGKTDTASVLMEAIGYIKFLQDQVETLSVPYMRPSGNKNLRTLQGASSEEEPKLDLRSRGLCLVPLSCTSYVTNDNGGTWSPPNFSGGT